MILRIIENNKGNSRGLIRNDHENSPGIIEDDCIGIVGDDSEEIIRDDLLGRYEMYVVSPQLKEELGVALIDSGSHVSFVKESSLVKFNREQNRNSQIYGVIGKQMEIKGQIKLIIENTLERLSQVCYVVDSLPRNLDIIPGQDWKDNAGYGFQKKTSVMI